jgi:hypothetical protein
MQREERLELGLMSKAVCTRGDPFCVNSKFGLQQKENEKQTNKQTNNKQKRPSCFD